jgi:quinol monooxygenase YgiN
MIEVAAGAPVITLVNVFRVEPEEQDALIDALVRATDDVIASVPGFVSASFHRSLDGTAVLNYAQWRSREDFEAIFSRPEVVAHFREIGRLARGERNLYEVVSVHEPRPADVR